MRISLLQNGPELNPGSTIALKNLELAHRIGSVVNTGSCAENALYGDTLHIPFDAVDAHTASRHGITGDGDIYGGVVALSEHADKAVLHTQVDALPHPAWYVPSFSNRVTDQAAVLPGFTVFTPEEAAEAYTILADQGLQARVKDPSERCERGQYCVDSIDEITALTAKHAGTIGLSGLVIEADLQHASTIAVGYVQLGGSTYCWYGQTWDTMRGNEKKFGGNEITVVKGDFDSLIETTDDASLRLAVTQTEAVLSAYPLLGASVSRATFDVVQGTAHDGRFLSGVTDPSIRPSASSPAEIHAVGAYVEFPDATSIITRVVYDYGHRYPSDEPNREYFARSEKTSIYVDLVDIA